MTRFAIAFSLLLGAAPALAQREPDHVLLARVCAHEAGFDANVDCEAIHAVLQRVAARSGHSYRAAAFAYSGVALRGASRRSYVAQLDERGREPASWPRMVTVCRRGTCRVVQHAPWSAYRERWLALVARAERIVAGAVAHSCDEEPDDWGGVADRERAARLGLRRISCGETRNDFYVRRGGRERRRAD